MQLQVYCSRAVYTVCALKGALTVYLFSASVLYTVIALCKCTVLSNFIVHVHFESAQRSFSVLTAARGEQRTLHLH